MCFVDKEVARKQSKGDGERQGDDYLLSEISDLTSMKSLIYILIEISAKKFFFLG